ncbi:hypothetical protein PS15p_210595 [Mucor circinelloides]
MINPQESKESLETTDKITNNKKYLSISAARKRQKIAQNYGCSSCSDHYDTTNELGDHLDEKYTSKARPEVDTSFESLKNENKWTLSTGTVVENQLYEFGKLQIGDHPLNY